MILVLPCPLLCAVFGVEPFSSVLRCSIRDCAICRRVWIVSPLPFLLFNIIISLSLLFSFSFPPSSFSLLRPHLRDEALNEPTSFSHRSRGCPSPALYFLQILSQLVDWIVVVVFFFTRYSQSSDSFVSSHSREVCLLFSSHRCFPPCPLSPVPCRPRGHCFAQFRFNFHTFLNPHPTLSFRRSIAST